MSRGILRSAHNYILSAGIVRPIEDLRSVIPSVVESAFGEHSMRPGLGSFCVRTIFLSARFRAELVELPVRPAVEIWPT